MQLLIKIKDDLKSQKLIEFLKELSVFEIQKTEEETVSNLKINSPEEFYKSINDDLKSLKLLDFFTNLSILEIQKNPIKSSNKKKLPDEFYKPFKIEKFIPIKREDIYEDIIH